MSKGKKEAVMNKTLRQLVGSWTLDSVSDRDEQHETLETVDTSSSHSALCVIE